MNRLKRLTVIALLTVIAVASIAVFSNYRANALSTAASTSTDPMLASLTGQLQSENALERADAARALSGTMDRGAIEALLANLGDEDLGAGYEAAAALAQSRDPLVMDSLLAELGNEAVRVRQRAALALSQMDTTAKAVPALESALSDSATAQMAARALVRINSPAAHDALLTALADDELTTRRHVVMAALEQADPAIRDAVLAQALASDNLLLVRNATELRDFLN